MSTATHVRLNTSLLAAPEKRLLIWIAGRLPRWIHSDHLSALGLAAVAGAGATFWLSGSHPVAGAALVVLCLLLNWFGDSLDSTVARVHNQLRPRYGYYLNYRDRPRRHGDALCRFGRLWTHQCSGGRAVGALALIVSPVITPFGLFEIRLFDLGGIVGVAGMVTTFVITSVRNARALYLEETSRSWRGGTA